MNYYNSFINTVQKLPSGTVFEITTDWLNANGISGATPSDAIAIGTEWAFEKGTKLTDEELGCFETDKEELIGCWRLRTGGMYNANYVNWAGFKDDEMGSWEPLGVRPVMWLKK